MPPTMVAYPPKVALNLEEFSAHRIMSVRLMKLYIFEKNLNPPPFRVWFWSAHLYLKSSIGANHMRLKYDVDLDSPDLMIESSSQKNRYF